MRTCARALPFALTAWLAACALPTADGRVHEQLPDKTSFPEVATVLLRSCGTLDCHGSAARNLRLYGSQGLRLAKADRPQTPACTTADEIDEDYASVVGLEPERVSAVVADGGADPERLSLVRKALGLEHHKGGAPFAAGSDADRCLRTWLADATDTEACLRALPRPEDAQCFAKP